MILSLPHHSQWHNLRQLVQTKSFKLRISKLWNSTTSHRASFKHSGLLFILLLSVGCCTHPLSTQTLHTLLQLTLLTRLAVRSRIRSTSLCRKQKLYFSLVWQDTAVYHPDLKTDTVPSGNLLQQLPTEQSNRKWFAAFFFYSTGYVKDKLSCSCLFIAGNLCGHKFYKREGNAKLFAKRKQALIKKKKKGQELDTL